MKPARDVLGPEAVLLLDTVEDLLEPAPSSGRAASEDGPWDWGRLYRLIAREKAAPAAFRNRTVARITEGAPEPWRKRFHSLSVVSEFRQQGLWESLDRILELLALEGMQPVPLKGAALGRTVYPSFLDRPLGDLDLLIPGGRAREAWDLLRTHGWAWDRDRFPLGQYRVHHHLPPLFDAQREGLVVEIHDGLLKPGHPFGLSVDDLVDTGQDMGMEAHLVFICTHFVWADQMEKGAWRTFRDVAVLQRTEGFRWDRVVSIAGESRASTCCYWTLRLAVNLAGVTVPDRVLSHLRPDLPRAALAALERHLALRLFSEDAACPAAAVNYALWRLAIQPERSGHGRTRPWRPGSTRAPGGEEPPGAAHRLVGHLRRLSGWRRWVGDLSGWRRWLGRMTGYGDHGLGWDGSPSR